MQEMNPAPQERPKVGLGVFVLRSEDDGYIQFLLGKRKSEFGRGKWSLPGGHLEFGEDWAACAARELLEETGLDYRGKEFKFIGATNDVHENRHYVTLYLGVEAGMDDEAQNLEPEKCEGWDWFTLDELALPADLWAQVKLILHQEFIRICNIVPPF